MLYGEMKKGQIDLPPVFGVLKAIRRIPDHPCNQQLPVFAQTTVAMSGCLSAIAADHCRYFELPLCAYCVEKLVESLADTFRIIFIRN